MSHNIPSVSKITGGVRVRFTDAWQGFQQPIEGTFLAGTKVTLSTLIKSSVARCLSIYLYVNGSAVGGLLIAATTDYTLYAKTFTIPLDTSNVSVVLQNNSTLTSDVDIKYIKLEMGIIATPPAPRPYAEELAMCQRYFVNLNYVGDTYPTYGFARVSNATTVFLYAPVPVSMRVRPSVTFTGTPYFYDTAQHNITAMAIDRFSSNMIKVRCTSTGMTVGNMGLIEGSGGSNEAIFLDSDIYP
jgi:hypothetical protein